jgi:hypothetical protein
MALDTRSPESVYSTRSNIRIPASDPRAATVVRDFAAQVEELDTTDLPATHTRAGAVITKTYVAQSKEV